MARPLPRDVENQIKEASGRAQWRSGLFTGLVIGSALGFGIGVSMTISLSQEWAFVLGIAAVVLLWGGAARARRKLNKLRKLNKMRKSNKAKNTTDHTG